MTARGAAVKVAIGLVHVPTRVRSARSAPLPDDVVMVLQIAAGDEEAIRLAADATGRTREVVREAAVFFIEQILFSPDADSYRVLGAGPQATATELRRNMALLLRWLHPDLDRQGARSAFACKVTAAWNDLKTAERRAAYDRSISPDGMATLAKRGSAPADHRSAHGSARSTAATRGSAQSARPSGLDRGKRSGLIRRALEVVLGGR